MWIWRRMLKISRREHKTNDKVPEHAEEQRTLMTTLKQTQKQVAQLWQRDRASLINDFRWGSIWGYYRLRSYFSCHCDTTQFKLTHHMANKPFLLRNLAAEYRTWRHRRWCANNIAADHQMFITLAGQLSWQRLRRSAVDLYSKAKKIAIWATL